LANTQANAQADSQANTQADSQAEARRRPDVARAAAALADFLRALGHAPEDDPELSKAPQLTAQAFAEELLSGYAMDPATILADTMEAGPDEGLVAVRSIQTTIVCPHHLLPAGGLVHLAYVPGSRLAGLGSLARLVQCLGRRLTLQETLVRELAETLMTGLGARGAGCLAEFTPACLTARRPDCHRARSVSMAAVGCMAPGEPMHAAFLQAVGGIDHR